MRTVLLPGLVLLATGGPSAAQTLGEPGSPLSVEVHGFVSQGAIKTTKNNYLTKSKRGSLGFNEVGINFTTRLTDNLRVGLQLFSRHLGAAGNYDFKADWFYLDYRLRDWLGVRAGRVKVPFGLYNEVNDIDSARLSILLPQSIYPLANRDFLLAQTGFEVYGYLQLRAAGALDYRLYAGTIFLDVGGQQAGAPVGVASTDTPYVVGGRLMWETPVDGLRVGGSLQALRLDAQLVFTPPGMAPVPVDVQIPAVLWTISAEYSAYDWLIAAEYTRWHVGIDSSNPALYPPPGTPDPRVSEGGYLSVAYRLHPRFQLGAYYSLLFPNIDDRVGRDAEQHDSALSFRFDINPYWLIKFEAHNLYGTAALDCRLNSCTSSRGLDMLPYNWQAFLLKTTAYF